MRMIISNLENWPRSRDNLPIFQCTEEGYFYANLIFSNEKQARIIRKAMENTRQQVQELRTKTNPNYPKMMRLACKGQFFRECLEELDRIHNDKFFT